MQKYIFDCLTVHNYSFLKYFLPIRSVSCNYKFQRLMKKKLFNIKSIILCVILAVSIFNTYAQSVTRLVGASPFKDSLWVFDTTSMAVLRRLAPSPSSGGPITGTNGIAKDPVSGSVYVVVKQSAVSGR